MIIRIKGSQITGVELTGAVSTCNRKRKAEFSGRVENKRSDKQGISNARSMSLVERAVEFQDLNDLNYRLAELLFAQGEIIGARKAVKAAIASNGLRSAYKKLLNDLELTIRERVSEAAEEIDDPDVHYEGALAYLDEGDLENAMISCLAAVALARREARYHYLLGEMYLKLEDWGKARSAFIIAQANVDSSDELKLEALAGLATASMREGNPKSARRAYRKILDIDKDDIFALYGSAEYYYKKGKILAALENLLKLLVVCPNHLDGLLLLSQCKRSAS